MKWGVECGDSHHPRFTSYPVTPNPVPVCNDNDYDDDNTGIGDHGDGDCVVCSHVQPCPRLQWRLLRWQWWQSCWGRRYWMTKGDGCTVAAILSIMVVMMTILSNDPCMVDTTRLKHGYLQWEATQKFRIHSRRWNTFCEETNLVFSTTANCWVSPTETYTLSCPKTQEIVFLILLSNICSFFHLETWLIPSSVSFWWIHTRHAYGWSDYWLKSCNLFWNIEYWISLMLVVWRKLWRRVCQTWEGRTQTSSGSLYSSSF